MLVETHVQTCCHSEAPPVGRRPVPAQSASQPVAATRRGARATPATPTTPTTPTSTPETRYRPSVFSLNCPPRPPPPLGPPRIQVTASTAVHSFGWRTQPVSPVSPVGSRACRCLTRHSTTIVLDTDAMTMKLSGQASQPSLTPSRLTARRVYDDLYQCTCSSQGVDRSTRPTRPSNPDMAHCTDTTAAWHNTGNQRHPCLRGWLDHASGMAAQPTGGSWSHQVFALARTESRVWELQG